MKKLFLGITLVGIAFLTVAMIGNDEDNLTVDFIKGNPEVKSINAMSFGPNGILFVGDSKSAAIFALDTKDVEPNENKERVFIEDFDVLIASSLGTSVDNIKITDMAVNPSSKNIFFSVNVGDGTPVLLKLNGQEIENISLKDVSYSKTSLDNPISEDAKDRRGRSQRVWAISDMKYHKGKVMVTGLSNKEFGSTFRSIPFPFNDTQDQASLEIYHVAHGQYETKSPIKAFNVITIENKDYLMASYTCTPLVLFPIDDLKAGKHVKGRTVAELGAGNSPLDMISFEKNGKPYFLMSNTNRPVMLFKYNEILDFKKSLNSPQEGYGSTGVPYVSLPMVNVLQLDNLDAENVVYTQRSSNGKLIIRSGSTGRLE